MNETFIFLIFLIKFAGWLLFFVTFLSLPIALIVFAIKGSKEKAFDIGKYIKKSFLWAGTPFVIGIVLLLLSSFLTLFVELPPV